MFDLAIYYRMAGGFVALGSTQLARLRWAIAMGCYMMLLSLVHHEGFLWPLIVFAGSMVGAFLGRLISHSRFQATASITNSLGMAAINAIRLALIVAPYVVSGLLMTHGALPVLRAFLPVFGIGAGIAYFVGNKYLAGVDSGIYYRNASTQYQTGWPTGIGAQAQLNHAAWGGTEWGELLTGWLAYELMFIVALVVP